MSAGARAAVAGVTPRQLSGAAIVRAVKDAGIEYVLSVPDLHTSQGVLKRVAEDNELKLIRVCKEDECLGIAAGLSYGNKRALILVQYTGFLYAMNAIRAIACEHQLPMVMMVGLLSKEPDVHPRASQRFGVRITEPILDVIGIEHHYIDTDADIGKIVPAIDNAYATSRPVALLIGRRPV
jgi:sulfopyruvate decarboxylase subunit alpha